MGGCILLGRGWLRARPSRGERIWGGERVSGGKRVEREGRGRKGDGLVDGLMDGGMDGWMDGRMNVEGGVVTMRRIAGLLQFGAAGVLF